MTLAGLNSLRQKKYQVSVKNWIFDDQFHKKGQILVIWVLGMIRPSRSVKNLMKWGCWGHWGHQGCWGHWGHWGCSGVKAWKITTEDFRVIQGIEFSYIWMFWKEKFWLNHEISCWILAPFLSEAVEARLYYFFKNCLIKTKCHDLLNRPPKIWDWKSQSVYLSEPIYFVHFNVRHPVFEIEIQFSCSEIKHLWQLFEN